MPISGLPVEPSEDTNELVINIGPRMGLQLAESDISVSRVREGVHAWF